MDPTELAREAFMLMLWISAPVLVTGMGVALIVGLLQALTQVQEQTVAFVPKLVAMILVMSLTLPWFISQLVDYTRELFGSVPGSL